MALLHTRVTDAYALKDGGLRIAFDGGIELSSAASAEYEAWNLVGPGGLRVVSLPGGDLAIWRADERATG